ncbi:MAG TPA: RlpA-like double-psi beta-barrel domain-containing protein [Candidatus Angelobacter sp.]|nr:RlpA-like double-psi beta-barrel domain-containing protein [Candidatus Angelobacter sp.]
MYDKNKLTAASRTLKFNTNIRVCRLNQTDKCVWLRITDRGPYVDGRDLDVSEAGAVALGFREAGLAKLQIVEMVPPARKTRRGF